MDSNRNEHKGAGKVALAVSGDERLQHQIRAALEAVGFQVLTLASAAEAPARVKARQPVLLLVDADLIDTVLGDGSRILETLKMNPYTSTVPLAVVLPRDANEGAQLEAFRRGADDCIVRAESEELFDARLRAVARRYCSLEEAAEVLIADGLVLDLRARKTFVHDKAVALTRKEFDLLNMLMRKRGIVVYTTHLYHSVWGYGESSPVDSHTVKVHVSSLRGKLGSGLGRKIVNLPGLGYRFDD